MDGTEQRQTEGATTMTIPKGKVVQPQPIPRTCSCGSQEPSQINIRDGNREHWCPECLGYRYTEGIDEPMPDKCPRCGADAMGVRWHDLPHGLVMGVGDYECETLIVSQDGRHVIVDGETCLRRQVAALRGRHDRLRQRYETLRAAVEDVADLIRGAAEKARQLHVINRDPYDDGRSVGFGTAVNWLRKALADHGGDDADGCVDAEVSDDA